MRDPDIRPVAIGDLVRWRSVQNDEQEEFDIDIGIVISLSRSSSQPAGTHSLHAQVFFDDSSIDWLPTRTLEIISS